ncbi:MAG TPA: sugar phosphate isomerase/epimerase family protein [Isosphaeraceae bacterium]|jgi:sugar phosphate isomerase/epimerase|nr:sugar phosphate isomerase/epimerase family protein [Isosphaeraceae bacterium]
MKFSYLMYEPVPDLPELTRRMERLQSLGYQGVELVATHPLGYGVTELAAVAERIGLPVVSLLSGWSYANEGLCLASPDGRIRDRAVERLFEYVGCASRLQAIVVVGLMQGLLTDEPVAEKAAERIAACLVQVATRAKAQSVKVVLEPVNHLQVGFHHTAAEAQALVARVGSPALGYMLDTIHMNIEERSLLGTIRHHGAQVRHFHLCETNGGPFGTGGLDFPGVLAALNEAGYDHYVSIKVYRHVGWQEAAQSSAAFLKRCGVPWT